jgi:uncharacterized integral membrane protein
MLRLIPALVLVLVLIVFGLSNRQAVTLGFWPTDYAATLPLSVAILIAMAIAFLLGAAVVWLDHLGLGGRARRAEAQVARLQAQLAAVELRAQPPAIREPDLRPAGAALSAAVPADPLPPPEG